ncbi:unnamed protein product [Rotaria magnacalcarata]|uniref:Protoporphyrinogen oxidase n=1 Tax=Rotaria magnacalcarata TaxID=392030 RepID=A0A8S2N511_9BILA|nr:unnamed protein product [Rotaria magnacalcarata]
MQKTPTIGIVGGGIAGLTSAYYLSQKVARSKIPHLRILLLERSPRFGGWIQSNQLEQKYDSHVFELGARTIRLHSGVASLSSHSAINTLKLLEQLNIFDSQFCPIEKTSAVYKNRLIYHNKKLVNLNDLSLVFGGKPLRYPPVFYALYEYFSEKGRISVQDETIKSFIYRRFGHVLAEDIVEYLLDPLFKGIYAGNVANLSARSVLKKIFNLEQRYGSILHAAFGYLIPSRENSHLLGVLFDSCVRHQTDKQKRGSQLTVMMGGAWFDQLRLGQCSDEQLMHIVMAELKKQMNLDQKPLVYSIGRLNKAIPNYYVGHEDVLDDINTLIRRNNLPLTLVGNSYRGIGISDVIFDTRVEVEYLNLETMKRKA